MSLSFLGVRNGWVNGMAGRQQVNQNVDINRVQEKVIQLSLCNPLIAIQ